MAAVQPSGRDLRELRVLSVPGCGVALSAGNQLLGRGDTIPEDTIKNLPSGDLSITSRVGLPPLVEA
jgi:hypothetical protein